MSQTITITGGQAGRKQALFPEWQLPYLESWQAAKGRITLHDLIAQVVEAEVTAYQQRQAEQQTLRLLTARQIAEGAAKGKIDSGGRELDPAAIADPETALATALEAFKDGLYFVFIDGNQVEKLDTPLQLTPNSTVKFLRLVALAGG